MLHIMSAKGGNQLLLHPIIIPNAMISEGAIFLTLTYSHLPCDSAAKHTFSMFGLIAAAPHILAL